LATDDQLDDEVKPSRRRSFSSRIDTYMDKRASSLARQIDDLEDAAGRISDSAGKVRQGVSISAKERIDKAKETIVSVEPVRKLREKRPPKPVKPIRSHHQPRPRTTTPSEPSPILSLGSGRGKKKGSDEPSPWVRSYVHLVTSQPILTIAVVIMVTLVAVMGISRTNIHGEMDVYLPKGSVHTEIVAEVREEWSTDLVVIYVQSEDYWDPAEGLEDPERVNITFIQILKAMEKLEMILDPHGQTEEGREVPSDRGAVDGVVFSLSLSTIIKELNSSNTRATDAAKENLHNWCVAEGGGIACDTGLADLVLNAGVSQEVTGHYRIPGTQEDIDDRVDDIPQNLLSKVVIDTNDNEVWDSSVMVFGITSDTDVPAFLEFIQKELGEALGSVDDPGECYDDAEFCYGFYTMELTGPVPVTNAITERSFSEFWKVFPIGVALAAIGIFIFHRRLRAVLIAGVPTLLAVLATYGVIGWTEVEVTPTIIALGPILMALGVAYGLHLTNRFTDETHPDLQERMVIAMSTTGKAIILSAVTTMIGFGSLLISTLSPIQTVGFSLVTGIAICVIMTFVLSPAIAILTQYDKRKAETDWDRVADIPTHHNKTVLTIAVILMLVSLVLLGSGALQTNIDYLEMAPNDEPSLVGIKKYSTNFNAGALGMVIGRGQFRSEFNDTQNDAMENLEAIECIQFGGCGGDGIVDVDQVTAISIIDLFKTVRFGVDVGLPPGTPDIITNILPITEYGVNRTFWEILHEDAVTSSPTFQKYLLNVFYDSLTEEALGMLMSSDFLKTLIYVDMPILSVNDMELAVAGVNDAIDANSGTLNVGALTGVAAIGVFINDMLIRGQLISIGIAVALVFLALWPTFRSWKLAALTTLPVCWVVALQPLTMIMLGQSLSLVTVMIGSIVIGVGVDFSIHITQRISETDMSLASVHRAVRKTGLSLFEATGVTILGLCASFMIAISALYWFVAIIMALIVFSMLGAMFLLPAMFSGIIKVSMAYSEPPEEVVDAASMGE